MRAPHTAGCMRSRCPYGLGVTKAAGRVRRGRFRLGRELDSGDPSPAEKVLDVSGCGAAKRPVADVIGFGSWPPPARLG